MATTKVNTEFIAVNAISGTIIADNAITATHIATNAISGTLVQNGGIVTTMIAANNITSTKIVTDAVLTRHIADDQVTADKLANAINTSIAAKLPLAGGTMTGTIAGFTSTGIDDNADATAITIDSSEKVGIGTTSPASPLHIKTSTNHNLEFEETSGDLRIAALNDARDTNVRLEFAASSYEFYTGNVTVPNLYMQSATPILRGTDSDDTDKYGQIEFDNGDIVISADANSGGGYHSGSIIKFCVDSGTERMRINNSGNVGIGTASPGQTLSVDASGGANFFVSRTGQTGGLYIESDGTNGVIRNPASNPILFQTNGANTRMQIGSTGKTSWSAGGIGTVATQSRDFTFYTEGSTNGVDIRSNDYQIAFIGGLGSSGAGMDKGYMQLCLDGSAKIAFNTDGDSYFNGGSVGIGTTSPGSLLHVAHSNGGTNPTARIENTTGTVAANSILLDLKFSGDDSFSNCDYIRFQDSSGEEGVITGDGGSRVYYEINSDYRLKENITSYSGGLNIINALSVKKYNYIKSPGTNYTGFLAHEVAEVVDGVARGVKDATEVLSNVVLNHNSVVIDQGVTETEWTDGKTSEKYASNTTWSASHTRNINQGLDLSKLVPDLVSAIQELTTELTAAKARISALEG